MARGGGVTQWLSSPQDLHLLGLQKWPQQRVEGECIFLISRGKMQQSKCDLSYKHRESGCRQSWLPGLNHCCGPDEPVTVTNWYRGDGFAKTSRFCYSQGWADFLIAVAGDGVCRSDLLVKVTAYRFDGKTDWGWGVCSVSPSGLSFMSLSCLVIW